MEAHSLTCDQNKNKKLDINLIDLIPFTSAI